MRVTRQQVQLIAQVVPDRQIAEWIFDYLGTHEGDDFELDLTRPGELTG